VNDPVAVPGSGLDPGFAADAPPPTQADSPTDITPISPPAVVSGSGLAAPAAVNSSDPAAAEAGTAQATLEATSPADAQQGSAAETGDQTEWAAPVAPTAEPVTYVVFEQAVLEEVRALARDFALKFKFDASRDRTIEDLSQELRGYRQGLHATLMRPIAKDLISIYDELTSLARYHARSEEPGSALLARTLEGFATTVEETLARNGFEPFETIEAAFVGGRQRADSTELTGDTSLDGLVAARIAKGFEYGGHVFRPERVVTYRYSPQATTVGTPAAATVESPSASDVGIHPIQEDQ